MAGKLGEIVDEKLDQLLRGGVIGGLVRPGLARVEDLRVHACNRDRHLEAEIRIRAELGSVQRSVKRRVEECARDLDRHPPTCAIYMGRASCRERLCQAV